MEQTSQPEAAAAPPPEVVPADITFEKLSHAPEFYRRQLMLPLMALPWDRPIMHIEGDQAKRLFRFCADSENLDLIPDAEKNIYSGVALSDDTQQLLEALNSAITNGIKRQIDPSEQAVRKRLLAWVDYLDQILALRAESQAQAESLSPGQHAA